MNAASELKVGIIGYGRTAEGLHGPALADSRDFRVTAVCDIEPDRVELARRRFDCAVYEDYRRMLSDEALDLVVVLTRSDQHCAMGCDGLAAGVHTLITKPWAVNAAEARRLVEAGERSSGLLLPWLPSRWGGPLLRLRELLAEGAIGEVMVVRRCCAGFNRRADWQTELRYGGGYILNWGAHVVDPPVLLAGGPVESTYAFTRADFNVGDGEDLFMAMVRMRNGILVQAEYTIAVAPPADWLIQGREGTIEVRGKRIAVHRKIPPNPADPTNVPQPDAGPEVREEEAGDPYGPTGDVYRDIAAAIRGERAFPVSPRAAYELSVTLDTVRVAADENRVVPWKECDAAAS
jgi:predicted dehydrogenase